MTTADDFRLALDKLADDNDDSTAGIYVAFKAGEFALDTAVARIAGQINRTNAVAVTLADTYVQTAIEELGEPALSVGLVPTDDSERLVKAANTILTEQSEDTPETRLTRLSHAEPFETAQRASVEAMGKQPLVEGWQRHFESAKPCQLCVWIARIGPDGPRVWPANHPFQTMHPGDKCVPKIVLRKSIQPTGRTRRNR
jgi:uncharacterized protein YndB with AHSA1/START domain